MILTTKELANRWRITIGHLANLRAARRGPKFFKIGRSVRYMVEDVKRYERRSY